MPYSRFLVTGMYGILVWPETSYEEVVEHLLADVDDEHFAGAIGNGWRITYHSDLIPLGDD